MRKKDQWIIHNISTGKSRSFDIRTKRSFRHTKFPFGILVKEGLTILISVLIIFTVVQADTIKITPPSGTPSATFYSLSEIYNFITANTTATVGNPALDWSANLEDTGRTLTEIYSALASLISADKVKSGTTYLNVAGTLAPDGTAAATDCLDTKTFYSGNSWTQKTGSVATQTLSADSDSVSAGYYAATTLHGVDADLAVGNIKKNTAIFGLTGTLYGDTDASKVLTTADGGGAAKGTYNAANLSTATVKKGTTFDVSSTGAYSGYPGSGWSGTAITQATCDAQNGSGWYWFEDGNGDGDTTDPEDGICVYAPSYASLIIAGSWNGYDSSTYYDATYIADYTCDGVSFPNGNVATYSGIDSSGGPDTTWNEVDCALCKADCMDGVKDLPANGGYKSAPGNGTAAGDYNGPLTPKVLAEWKGTRLPTSADFFGFCGYQGNGSAAGTGDYSTTNGGYAADKTFGSYGIQVGRTDEFLDLANKGTYEWLSEQRNDSIARVAGGYACSYFNNYNVNNGYRFRAVFRP